MFLSLGNINKTPHYQTKTHNGDPTDTASKGEGGKQSTLGASRALAQCKALSMFKKVQNLMPSVLQNGNAQG